MTQGDADKIRILIATDDTETRESLQKFLASQPDFEVIGLVSTGREAVEFATEHHPDVIIMDDAMPEMDGFEATKSITRKTNIGVIIMSESTDTKIIQQGMLSGARFYLTKPITDEQLTRTIRIVIPQYEIVRNVLHPTSYHHQVETLSI